jgi:hypothetical protein
VFLALLGPLGRLDLLPVGVDLVGVGDRHVAEHVRMPPDELVDDRAGHVVDGEVRVVGTLGGHDGVEGHLHEHVAEFLPERVQVAAVDGVEDLVGLLEQIGRQRGVGLLAVPRALAAQPVHHRHQVEQPGAGQIVGRVQHLDIGSPRPGLAHAGAVRHQKGADLAEQPLVAVGGGDPHDRARPGRLDERPGVGRHDLDRHAGLPQIRQLRVVGRAGEDAGGRPQGLPGRPGEHAGRHPVRGGEHDQRHDQPVPEPVLDSR